MVILVIVECLGDDRLGVQVVDAARFGPESAIGRGQINFDELLEIILASRIYPTFATMWLVCYLPYLRHSTITAHGARYTIHDTRYEYLHSACCGACTAGRRRPQQAVDGIGQWLPSLRQGINTHRPTVERQMPDELTYVHRRCHQSENPIADHNPPEGEWSCVSQSYLSASSLPALHPPKA
jgi:hypothetical protein